MNLLAQSPIRVSTDWDLAVVPMFILMGSFATASGMSRELFHVSNVWLGHRRGGLAMATITACAGFSAINGSSVATAATMTQVALPEMRRAGYDPGFATGAIAAGGTLGIMIPPSVMFVIYGALTENDVSKLLVAGILPGIVGTILYINAVQVMGILRPQLMPRGERHPWRERIVSAEGCLGHAAAVRFLHRRNVRRLVHGDRGRRNGRRRGIPDRRPAAAIDASS